MIRNILLFIFFVSSFNTLKAQGDYCRWEKCKYGGDCMEGPSWIYGDFHPGCEKEYWKRNPEEYKKLIARQKRALNYMFKMMGDDLRKDREEENRKRKVKEYNDNQYVQNKIREHLDYSNNLVRIYNDPIKRRNYIIGFLSSNEIKFSLKNYKKFSDLNHLLKYYENRFNKTIYNGKGDEYKNALELPSQYLFLPQGRMPYIENLNSYNAIIEKHHENLDILEEVFNSKILEREAVSIETLKKFEVFKTLDIPISEFQKANSYDSFLKLYSESKNISIIDFRELSTNINVIESQETQILEKSFNLQFNNDHDIWNYFFGETKNHQSLSLNKKKKIIHDNIINYVSVFGKDYKEISPKMKIILRYEDRLLSEDGKWQSGGIKRGLPEYWSFNNTLLRPIIRFKLFNDFAMVYNFLIKDYEKALIEKRPVTRTKNHKITLSFKEYLKDEDEYIRKLGFNKRYIDLNPKLASLTFTETQGLGYRGVNIRSGTLIYDVIKAYNNRSSFVTSGAQRINNGDNILRDQKELKKKYEIFYDLYEVLHPLKIKYERRMGARDLPITSKSYRDNQIDNLLGYSANDKALVTYWDFSSFSNDTKEYYLKYLANNKPNNAGRTNDVTWRIWAIARFHNLFPYLELNERGYGAFNEILIVSSEIHNGNFLSPNIERARKEYEKRISESIKISDLKHYLGVTKNDELESNGKALMYFLKNTSTQIINEIVFSFNQGIIIPEITTDIDVTLSDNLETYMKGFNLFIRTIPLKKEHEALIKNYFLKLYKTKKRKKIAIFNLSTSNNTPKKFGKLNFFKKNEIPDLSKYASEFNWIIQDIIISKDKKKVTYKYSGNVTPIMSDIESDLEKVYGGDWFMKSMTKKKMYFQKKDN